MVSTGVFALGPTGAIGYSGLEHVAWLQARGLAEKGHQVALVAPEGSSCPGVTVIPIGPAGQWDEKRSYGTYWQHLPQFDVIIDNSWNKHSYTLKMEGKLKAPILSVLHAPVDTMFKAPPPVDKPCMVCISDDQKSNFEGLFGKHQARRAYNGVDLDYYKPLNTPRSDRFLFLARFSSVKSPDINQEICLQAGVGLDMVGDCTITQEPELLKHCQRRADGKQIKIVGGCTRGETVYFYSQARALAHVCPNFREPFGLAPVEAQACGLPVLGFRYGALTETVCHGETGFLVTSIPEAVDVVKSGALDALSRDRCRENASRFSVQNMVTRYEELCQEALGGGW